MNARQSRRGKRLSKQQEQRAAADLGGRTMAASGATRLGGGADVRVMGKTRLECKVTEKDIYTLRFIELQKVRKQAIRVLESPVLQFAFRHTSGRMTAYAVVPWVVGDQQKDNDHNWYTTNSSIGLTQNELEKALFTGRIMFTFMGAGKEQMFERMFEILRWHDYVEKTALMCREEPDA